MTAEELFKSKQDLVFTAIIGRFKSIPTARRIARANNMELEDLMQIGQMILWENCQKYDPAREETFNGYVVQVIKWKITNELHTKGKLIKVSNRVSYEERDNMCFHSIDLHSDEKTENDFFAVSPFNVEEDVLNKVELSEIFRRLNEKEKFILMQKSYGYSDKAIGHKIGKSEKAVNQMKSRAFLKLNSNYSAKHASKILTLAPKRKNHLRQQVI